MKMTTFLLTFWLIVEFAQAQSPTVFRTGVATDNVQSYTPSSVVTVTDSLTITGDLIVNRRATIDTLLGNVHGLGGWAIGDQVPTALYGLRVQKTWTTGSAYGLYSAVEPGANSMTIAALATSIGVTGGYTGHSLTGISVSWGLGSGSATNLYGIKFSSSATAGSATNSYAIYFPDEWYGGSTNNWFIYGDNPNVWSKFRGRMVMSNTVTVGDSLIAEKDAYVNESLAVDTIRGRNNSEINTLHGLRPITAAALLDLGTETKRWNRTYSDEYYFWDSFYIRNKADNAWLQTFWRNTTGAQAQLDMNYIGNMSVYGETNWYGSSNVHLYEGSIGVQGYIETGDLRSTGVSTWSETSAPGTPALGKGYLYAGTDSKIYWKDDGGVAHDLTATGSGSGLVWGDTLTYIGTKNDLNTHTQSASRITNGTFGYGDYVFNRDIIVNGEGTFDSLQVDNVAVLKKDVWLQDSVSIGYLTAVRGVARFTDGATNWGRLYARSLGAERAWSFPDSSGTLALKEYTAPVSHNQSASTITSGTFASGAPSQYVYQDEVRINGLLGLGRDATTYALELNGSIGFYGTNQITGAGGGSVAWNGSTITVPYGGTGATSLSGYVYGNGTSAFTAVSTIPASVVSAGTHPYGDFTFQRNVIVNGNVNTDSLQVTSGVISNFPPQTTNTYNLGGETYRWAGTYSDEYYLWDRLFTRNKADNAWLTWGTRNTAGAEAYIDLTQIGSISTYGELNIYGYSQLHVVEGNFQVDRTMTADSVVAGTDMFTVALTGDTSYARTSGWSAWNEKDFRWKKQGKTVHFWFHVNGTSNSSTTTITLPYTVRSTSTFPDELWFMFRCTDNGTGVAGIGRITPGSTTLTFYKDASGTSFTSSGTKKVNGYLCYETD